MKQEQKINPERIGAALFYTGLFIELLIMLLDKSAWINPYEGMMFRVSFLLFAGKLCITKYSAKELAAIIGAGIIAGICYLVSTRDEAVRVVVFVAAMKGLDGKKVLKTVFWTTLAGMVLLAGLACAGILGTVMEIGTGYGFKAEIDRVCLGLGNSNALSIMIWALMTLGIYLYHEKMRLWHYGILLILSAVTYVATVTRTSLLMMLFTIVLAAAMQYRKKLRDAKWVYGGGVAVTLVCLGFSVWAAKISKWPEFLPGWIVKIDRIITGRITSIYAFENGGGVLRNWRLFSNPDYIEYFDMGYVRLFFWYGIIPGVCVMFALCMLLWNFHKNKDYMGFVLTISFAIFTVIEAHIVSVYIARNYVLFLLGMYWMELLGKKTKEAYWWKFWTLFEVPGSSRKGNECP